MALCTVISGSAVVIQPGVDASACTGPVLLSAAEYTDWLSQMAAFGFDQGLFFQAFVGGLLIFVTGLGIGLLLSLVRKARTP